MLGEVQPAVVVGIGYPEAESDMKVTLVRRQYDLTPTQSDPKQAAQAGLATDLGGADAFLQVIEREVKPRIAAMLHVDSSRDILFGHSSADCSPCTCSSRILNRSRPTWC